MKRKNKKNPKGQRGKPVAIYHRVFSHEGFEHTAKVLLKLLKQSQEISPNKKRSLFIDVDGHKNSNGGPDPEIQELFEFIVKYLMDFFTEVHLPIWKNKTIVPKGPQRNDIPDHIRFSDEPVPVLNLLEQGEAVEITLG